MTFLTRITNAVISNITANTANISGNVISGSNVITDTLVIQEGGNTVALQAAASSANYTLTMPETLGSNNQILSTLANGVLQWRDLSVASVSNGNSNINIAAAAGNISFAVNGTANVAVVSATGITANSLAVTGTSNLGAVGNVTITGGSAAQVLTTNGSGALSWATPALIANGTSNVAVATAAGNVTVTANGNTVLTVTDTGANVSGTANVTGNLAVGATANIAGALLVATTANITGNLTVSSNAAVGANLTVGASITATGNVSAVNFMGVFANGNSNVNIPTANGNVNISAAGNANVLVVTGIGANVAGTVSANNFVVTGNIGNAQSVQFDVTANITSNSEGLLYWSEYDQTLNINHESGVVQQVGQEQYILTLNTTGSNITNGTVVGFSGADANTSRITVSPYQANGAQPTVNLIGVATQDIANANVGFITTFGVVRSINASGNTVSESWNVGDILYANPNTAGALTKVRPTAPNNVIPVAAVLSNNASTGELFVRPTIEQQLNYGRFVSANGNLVANAINTAQTVVFSATDIASGISLVDGNANIQVTNSGYYQLNVNLQVVTTDNSPSTCYAWIRKDGTDVPYSMHRVAVDASASPVAGITIVWGISLAANSKVQIAWATNDTDTVLQTSGNTAFGPSTAAVVVDMIQAQL